MPATIPIGHPILTQVPQTYLSVASNPGDANLSVQNSTDFSISQYILIGTYGNPLSQILLISGNNPSITQIQASPNFGYPVDTPVTYIPFNEIRVYRSVTGLGGTYSLISQIPMQVDQQQTTFTDLTAISPYSYKFTYYNSNLNLESDFSSEIPYAGFPQYSLQSIQDRVLSLFVDSNAEFIQLSDISSWTNELCSHLNREVTDSDNQAFANYVTFIPGSNEYTDITTYGFEAIMLVEYTYDGQNYIAINPMDSRFSQILNSTSTYSWRLINQNLFIYGNFGTCLSINRMLILCTI